MEQNLKITLFLTLTTQWTTLFMSQLYCIILKFWVPMSIIFEVIVLIISTHTQCMGIGLPGNLENLENEIVKRKCIIGLHK